MDVRAHRNATPFSVMAVLWPFGQYILRKKTMQNINVQRLSLGKSSGFLGSSVFSEIRRMEQERASLARIMAHNEALSLQMKKLAEVTSFANQFTEQAKNLHVFSWAERVSRLLPEDSQVFQLAKQIQELHKTENESIRRMLIPIQDIHRRLLVDSATKRISDELAQPFFFREQAAQITAWSAAHADSVKAMQASIEGSKGYAQKIMREASVIGGIGERMKAFERINKNWVVPQSLSDALGPLKALQEQVGRLALPVMDAASAATLASVLGPEGIDAQLAKLGISADGSLNTQLPEQEGGIGLSRKTLEVMGLISFFLAIFVPIYQEISAAQWQTATDQTIAEQAQRMEAQSIALERQAKMISALSQLIEEALIHEAKRQEERFVVLDRVTVVRAEPEHGSAVEGKLLPREVVRPISERGKWIEFEYYHWLHQDYRTGWSLKKYFQRVPANFERPGEQKAEAQ